MSKKLTKLGLEVLRAIDNSEYGDCLTDPIWTWSVWDNIDRDVVKTRKSLGGVVARLANNGWVYVTEDGDDSCLTITGEGAQVYMEAVGRLNTHKWLDKDHLEEQRAFAESLKVPVQEPPAVEVKPVKKSAKGTIREMLLTGNRYTLQDFVEATGFDKAKISVILSDLKNPKYAGKAGPLDINKLDGFYFDEGSQKD